MSSDQLNAAFDRIEDFLRVNTHAPTLDAVLCLQAAVGIEDEHRVVIRERVERLREGHGQRGDQIGGLLLGLILAGLGDA